MTRSSDSLGGKVIQWGTALVVVAAFFGAAETTLAEDYHLFGRVYGTTELPPGEEPPETNPLHGKPAGEIIGEPGLVATGPLSMVKVKILNDSGSGLDTHLSIFDGGYFTEFTGPAGGLEVTIEVRDALTDELFLRVQEVSLSPGNNRRLLLAPVDARGVGASIPYPTGLGTAIFTRVGAVEFNNIHTSAGSKQGLAKFPGKPTKFQDAPFGGTLELFGAFSRGFYPSSGHGRYVYKIKIDGPGDPPYMNAPLVKRRYTVNVGAGKVTSSAEVLGPLKLRHWLNEDILLNDCYRLTPIAEVGNVFWSYPDLLARWPTGSRLGKHKLTLELWELTTLTGVTGVELISDATKLGSSDFSSPDPLPLTLDNRRIDVGFKNITDPSGEDLLGADHRCDIIKLGATGDLTFEYIAHHETGYLREYSLRATPNRQSGSDLTRQTCAPAGATEPVIPYYGTSAGGDTVVLTSINFKHSCSYIFDLVGAARTTNGRSWINWKHDRVSYYVLLDGS